MSHSYQLKLATSWTPANGDDALSYVITLTNNGDTALAGIKLAINGPARIDPLAEIEGAKLEERLSNYSVFSGPEGFELGAGASWEIRVHGLSYGLRHWSDGANSAYVILADGGIAPVTTAPTIATGGNAPLLKGAMRLAAPGKMPAPISVIPWPEKVNISGRLAVPAGLDVQADSAAGRKAGAAFAHLVADLFPVEGLVRGAAEGGLKVELIDKAELATEAYEIEFSGDGVTVFGSAHQGFLYGLITLGQILRGAQQHKDELVFPSGGRIEDKPGFGWRGCHLDVARQFYAGAEIEQLLKIMAWNKLNRFHWHLSEDEAWRLEIDAFPELTEIAAWRGHGKAVPPLLGSGPEPTGGFYTKAAVREIVALGQRLGVEIVPEIDIPGHCYALLQALPQLRDPDEIGEYQSVQGFPNNCLNPAHEAVYKFIEIVIDEVLELFPLGIFHLGADEVPMAAWSGSPMALAMLAELAGKEIADKHAGLVNTIGNLHGADEIEGSGTAILQAEFIRRVHAYIASKGAETGGWEEAAHGDVVNKDKIYLIGWRNVEVNVALGAAGYDIVASPGQHYYLDMANSLEWSEPGAGWAGWSGPEETYNFEARTGWAAENLQHLRGVQACIWSEPMTDRAIFDRLVFPRLSAIAEAGWTLPERKSWERFKAFASLMPIMYGHWAD